MHYCVAFAIWVFTLVLIVYLWKKKENIFPDPLWWWEYIVLLRVPIITSLIVFLLPIVASLTPASVLLKNLFVMRNWWQLAIVVLITAITTLMIVIVLTVIFVNALERYPHYFDDTIPPGQPNLCMRQRRILIRRFPKIIRYYLYKYFINTRTLNKKEIESYYPFLLTLSFILALPTLITTVVLSIAEIGIKKAILGFFVGILLTILCFNLTYIIGKWIGNGNIANDNNIKQCFRDLIKFSIIFISSTIRKV